MCAVRWQLINWPWFVAGADGDGSKGEVQNKFCYILQNKNQKNYLGGGGERSGPPWSPPSRYAPVWVPCKVGIPFMKNKLYILVINITMMLQRKPLELLKSFRIIIPNNTIPHQINYVDRKILFKGSWNTC